MSSHHNKKYDTDEFEAQMNKEQLLNIYQSFENDSFDFDRKKKKGKKPKTDKKRVIIKTDSISDNFPFGSNKRNENHSPKVFDSEKNKKGFVKPDVFGKKNSEKHNLEKKHKSTYASPSKIEIDEQDEIAPKTLIVTKEPPAIKIYAILSVLICFLIIGGLVYKSISDKNIKKYTENINNTVGHSASSQITNENNEYVDYEAMMSEVYEPDELRIVNESRPIGIKDIPSLVGLSCMPVVGSAKLEKNAHEALGLMYKSMRQDGAAENLRVFSGYRSYSYQYTRYKTFSKYMKKQMGVKDADACEALSKQLFAKAGTSEHQLGTSVDLCIGKELSQDFLSTDAGMWLLKNAYKYGFIFRYSAENAGVHKRTVEPWHLRYVGVTAAEKIFKNNISLEEYLGI